ncbi:hypothetical protein BDQ17DRAFT_901723 [Cyathus striatus]|nr:hypothetical protein BDQ17DRAFT_901723 [Cyathus striatus]
MIPPIPLEIIDIIIEEVSSRDDKKCHDLQSCALACRNFLNPSQRRIFRSIILFATSWSTDSSTSIESYLRFQDTLNSSPHIALYIHKFALIERKKNPLFINLPSFSGTLAMLENIMILSLNFYPNYDWNDVAPQSQQALFTVLSSSKLEFLGLSGIRSLPLISAECIRKIPDVSMSDITFDPKVQVQDSQYMTSQSNWPEGRHLKSLYLDEADLIQPFLDGISPPHCRLETLTLQSVNDFPVAVNVMKKHTSYLTTLIFVTPPMSDTTQEVENNLRKLDILDIGTLCNLQTIQISVHLFGDEDPAPFKYCTRILNKARNENDIQKVIIHLNTRNLSALVQSDKLIWKELDQLLSEHRFSKLREVYFAVHASGSVQPSEYVLNGPKLPLWNYLPRLYERGVLKANDMLTLQV